MNGVPGLSGTAFRARLKETMTSDDDTIVAVSTAPGRGAIGIVRLSGARAQAIAGVLCRVKGPLAAGRVRRAELLDAAGEVLDEAVVTLWVAPRSYTSEDVVEIACHGAPVVLEAVVRRAIAAGARLAEPGEFTQRAFLAGRLDLTQAEAVNDLIAAQTLEQARVAAAQLGGSLARTLAPVKHDLIQLIAALEAGIDFAEDDLDLLPDGAIAAQLQAIVAPLQALADSYRYGRTVREGFTLAIVGRPNAGKSSLFNRLLGRERAIVTAQAGTTRDSIAETRTLAGIPVRLVDTAGLREEATDDAEVQGMARTRMAIADADVVLHVIDATAGPEEMLAMEGRPCVVAWNKVDLAPAAEGRLGTSAVTGEGIAGLEAAIVAALGVTPMAADSAMVTNLRQQRAVEEALVALERAALGLGLPHELLLLDLHAGLEALGSLTGVTTSEDLLRVIFSNFCIGK
jgi:tRNA modification GTPase